MRVLVTGKGSGGSWQMRGEQLGRAIGATVQALALDVGGYDLAVMVKRPAPELVARLHKMEVPIVWDMVDFWPQPLANVWSRDECMASLKGLIGLIRPAALVAATQTMAEDCAAFGLPVLALPHHSRDRYIAPAQVRNTEHLCVAYEGSAAQLGKWAAILEAECTARGWSFVAGPDYHLGGFDIVVALREGSGYAPKHWKSNVKLANAQAAGVPFIGTREAGYMETASGGEHWADTPRELTAALDALANFDARSLAASRMRCDVTLPAVAQTYKAWLETLHA
jgi:hypothetical protein